MTPTIDITRARAIPSPFMSDDELRWLAERASRAAVIVEIGCAYGRSTRALGDHTSGVVYAVDPWQYADPRKQDRYEVFQRELADLMAIGRVRPMRMSSLEAAQQLADLDADFVFIDASHRYENVLADIDAWFPRVRFGGVLAGHDYWPEAHPGVRRAVHERFGIVERHADSIWAVQL